MAALVAALTGCTSTHVVGVHRTLFMGLTEYRLSPDSVRTARGELTVFVRNYGRLTHDLSISQNGRVAGATPPIAPGHTASLRVQLSRGSYVMTSDLFSDRDVGLFGTVTVQ